VFNPPISTTNLSLDALEYIPKDKEGSVDDPRWVEHVPSEQVEDIVLENVPQLPVLENSSGLEEPIEDPSNVSASSDCLTPSYPTTLSEGQSESYLALVQDLDRIKSEKALERQQLRKRNDHFFQVFLAKSSRSTEFESQEDSVMTDTPGEGSVSPEEFRFRRASGESPESILGPRPTRPYIPPSLEEEAFYARRGWRA
jgi:hypothetical protein